MDIWGASDQFNFNYQNFSGDGTILAKVASQTNPSSQSKAGVMFRNDATASSAFADVVALPNKGLDFQWRPTAGGTPSSVTVANIGVPAWVKLTRAGNAFSAYYSTDGSTWTQIGSTQTITMGSTALAGLAVTAHLNTAASTAMFNNVTLTPASAAEPTPTNALATATSAPQV